MHLKKSFHDIVLVFRHNSELVEFLRARRDYNFLKPHGRELARFVANLNIALVH